MNKHQWNVKLAMFLNQRAAMSNVPDSNSFKLGYLTSLLAGIAANNTTIAKEINEYITFVLADAA